MTGLTNEQVQERGLQKEKLMSTRTRIPEPTSRSFWKTRHIF